ncbi:MAG: AbrB/MazE/SpoVT family DNA-binding domain-containing protein [Bacillota bacterium]
MAKQLVSGKMTSKGQLTIPVELRILLNLKEGDRLAFVLDENKKVIDIHPKKKKSIRSVVGLLKSKSSLSFEEARELAHQKRAEEIRSKMMRDN